MGADSNTGFCKAVKKGSESTPGIKGRKGEAEPVIFVPAVMLHVVLPNTFTES